MKKLILSLTLVLASVQVSAASKYCNASKKTTAKIDQLRIVELPFQIVQSEVVKALLVDKCVSKRLSTEEVATLAEMLLNYEYSEDTAAQIIGEFLAQ
ncbi:hypothetical protein [Bdellovibrio sp. HCB2-146]|uniref:hypothetical protein n=1 Tax=Bdellovibrio sp. HCB2-146 TaxID=3394362 RepID=UPI0039BD5280